jgi:UDP-N-acetylmuramoyl-tripeptide--D-alanyl-D-alanine ligase
MVVGLLIVISLIVGVGFYMVKQPNAISRCSNVLTADLLETSLDLGTQFIINNQTSAGNFVYEYNWISKTYTQGDSQVRQAGAGWGLALIYKYKPAEETKKALIKALEFMNSNSQLDGNGGRFVVYPNDKRGRTGTVALVALAHLDFIHSGKLDDTEKAKYQKFAAEYVQFLVNARRDDGLWYSSYLHEGGTPVGKPSSYFDGEALLALIKAARYHGFDHLRDLIIRSAHKGYLENIVKAREKDPDSNITKGYYQWSSMAFFELSESGWNGTKQFGDYVVELADWMIDVHHTLKRTRNTAYAYEGMIHAYKIALDMGDEAHVKKFGCTIDKGLEKLTSWQVGSPIALSHIAERNSKDVNAIGGVQNHARYPELRIDVAQHQMAAVILALKYYFPSLNQAH